MRSTDTFQRLERLHTMFSKAVETIERCHGNCKEQRERGEGGQVGEAEIDRATFLSRLFRSMGVPLPSRPGETPDFSMANAPLFKRP